MKLFKTDKESISLVDSKLSSLPSVPYLDGTLENLIEIITQHDDSDLELQMVSTAEQDFGGS